MARVGETVGQAFADGGDRYAHSRAFRDNALERRGAGAVHRNVDLIRRRAERGGQFLAGLGEALGQIAASGVEVLGDVVVSCCNGVANPRSAGHDRLALIGHFGDKQADLALVVGIGALKRGHLGSYAGLELGGARQRAFHPIAHRGEFATDGLGQVRDMLAGHRLGFGQAHGDLGDRSRRLSQLQQPPG